MLSPAYLSSERESKHPDAQRAIEVEGRGTQLEQRASSIKLIEANATMQPKQTLHAKVDAGMYIQHGIQLLGLRSSVAWVGSSRKIAPTGTILKCANYTISCVEECIGADEDRVDVRLCGQPCAAGAPLLPCVGGHFE